MLLKLQMSSRARDTVGVQKTKKPRRGALSRLIHNYLSQDVFCLIKTKLCNGKQNMYFHVKNPENKTCVLSKHQLPEHHDDKFISSQSSEGMSGAKQTLKIYIWILISLIMELQITLKAADQKLRYVTGITSNLKNTVPKTQYKLSVNRVNVESGLDWC